jgi:hypothetical protein
MEVQEIKKLKDLEEENAKLKCMYANLSLLNEALKDAVAEKLRPDEKGSLAAYMIALHKVSQRQALKAIGLPQIIIREQMKPKQDDELIRELQVLVEKHPVMGFSQYYYCQRRKGFSWNHNRVYRGLSSTRAKYP